MVLVIPVFVLASVIVIIGFLGIYLFKRTGIPDIAILLLIGLLLGPIFKLIDPATFAAVAPLIAAITLVIILFESGLNLNFYTFLKETPQATLLAVLHVLATMGLTAVFGFYIWEFPWVNGLLLGAMIGGTSAPIVVPMVSKLKTHPKVSAVLGLESTFTDALTIVIAIALLQLLLSPSSNGIYEVGPKIASAFSIAAVFGFIGGIIWLRLLRHLRGELYDDILTLAAVFLVYAIAESLGGNGAVSSLIFGMVLGNGFIFTKFLKFKHKVFGATDIMRKFHAQISFLVRTFFFVYLGMIIAINNLQLVAFSVILTVLLLGGRFIVVWLSSFRDKILKGGQTVMSIMIPRGLAAAVLSQLPIIYGMEGAQLYPDIVFTVIITSVVITTVGIAVVSRKKPAKEKLTVK